MARESRHRPGRLTLIGAAALALHVALLLMGAATEHAHRAPTSSLFDEACPDVRLAMCAENVGTPAPRLSEALVPRPTDESLCVAIASVVPDVRIAPTLARAPPNLA